MNASQVSQIFEAYYEQLRDANNENAPSSYVYFGATIEAVAEESDQEFDGEFAERLGSEDTEIVAVAVDLHNYDWHAIHADATEGEVRNLFESCGGEVSACEV
jgi:hypothetical protein